MWRVLSLLVVVGTAGCTDPKAPTGQCAASPAASGATATAASPPAAAAPSNDAIARAIDDWHDAAAHADEARYFGHFAEGAVFLGTDGKERWTLPQFRAYAHPHFAAKKAWTFRSTRREITIVGDTAWFDEDLDTPHLGPARGTGVLVRDASGTWKIAQYNLSVPIPNDRFREVRTLIDGPPPKPVDHGY